MIVDTSAIMAVSLKEEGYSAILDAMLDGDGYFPSPVLLEYRRALWSHGEDVRRDGEDLLQHLLHAGNCVEGFSPLDAQTASIANVAYGKGNGDGGKLNFGDLMVYAVARRLDLPVLCTGRDFVSTDIAIHPASRTEF
jgi:ribonuclease VapC